MGPDQDISLLAAEYVLGTLSATAAAYVEHNLESNAELQREVAFWEQQLGQLGLALPPVEPPAEAWALIQQRLQADTDIDIDTKAQTDMAAGWRRSLRFWQGLAVAASTVVVILAGLLYISAGAPARHASAPTYVSLFFDQDSSVGWFLNVNTGAGRMAVTVVGDYPLAKGKELRLWVIPKVGTPVASGLLPSQGDAHWSLSRRVAKLLKRPSTTLAISVEAVGASTANGPQGPVRWHADVHREGHANG